MSKLNSPWFDLEAGQIFISKTGKIESVLENEIKYKKFKEEQRKMFRVQTGRERKQKRIQYIPLKEVGKISRTATKLAGITKYIEKPQKQRSSNKMRIIRHEII